MPDYISSKEFERTFKQMNNNVSKIVEFKEEQIGINATVKGKIAEVEKKQSYFIKIILIVLGFFSSFAGIGFYTSAEATQEDTEEKPVKMVNHD